MIRWTSGKAGFAGAAKRFFKGVFSFRFTAPTEIIESQDLPFGVLSRISQKGQGVESTISSSGQGVYATISQSSGYFAIISSDGRGVEATISDRGIGVEGTL